MPTVIQYYNLQNLLCVANVATVVTNEQMNKHA